MLSEDEEFKLISQKLTSMHKNKCALEYKRIPDIYILLITFCCFLFLSRNSYFSFILESYVSPDLNDLTISNFYWFLSLHNFYFDEFIDLYERSSKLAKIGLVSVPCSNYCWYLLCQGWKVSLPLSAVNAMVWNDIDLGICPVHLSIFMNTLQVLKRTTSFIYSISITPGYLLSLLILYCF